MFHRSIIRFPILLLVLAGVAAAQTLPRLDGGVTQQAQPAATQAAPATGWKAAKPVTAPLKPPAGTPLPATPAAVQTPSPADLPPNPAAVQFRDGLLTVHAENSSLTQILKDITAKTGMTVEGTPDDERVFGSFGPAPVASVVAQLFDGSSSNYILFGRAANQAPRSLIISPKASLAPPADMAANGAAPPAAAVNNDDDDDDDAQPVAPIRPLVPIQQPENQAQPPSPPGIRTPQQILEDMQRRRQEQQQQQSQ